MACVSSSSSPRGMRSPRRSLARSRVREEAMRQAALKAALRQRRVVEAGGEKEWGQGSEDDGLEGTSEYVAVREAR